MIVSIFNIVFSLLINFYSLSFTTSQGVVTNMSTFQGKRILLVNIATGSTKVNQLVLLQQLQQQYADKLTVILFPSNDFGHENRTDSQIRQFCQTNYNSTFIIAQTSHITGNESNSIFQWLGNQTQNGDMNAGCSTDFQKYLIGTDGKIIGVFSSKISPIDPEIITAINMDY